jgi:alkylhydroperoxidase family enzyme
MPNAHTAKIHKILKEDRMARIPPVIEDAAPPAARKLLEQQRAAHGRTTNMKRTLAHSPVALQALMTWYDLHAEVSAFLGSRGTTLFVHAISSQTNCLICSTFFRRWLIEAGENPDALKLDDCEQTLVDFGRQLVRDANAVSDELFTRLRAFLKPEQLVALTAFGGMMIATNIFNNALRVDLDEYLLPFKKGARE